MKNVGQLSPNKRNPRKITKARQEALKKALDEFGDLGSIIYNVHSAQLVGGHQRVSVLPKDAPITIEKVYSPPTRTGTVAEGFVIIEGEKFKYREVNWDKMKEKAAMIAANAHGGEWDSSILNEELSFLKKGGLDMELTGLDLNLDSVSVDLSMPKSEVKNPAPTTKSEESASEEDESDEEYVKNTPETTEQIDVERPSNVKYESKGFDQVEEQQGVKGQRFVIIIDCKDQDSKAALKEKLMPIIEEAGAKVF